MTISITNYSSLDGKYTVHGTIGSGGFGKVKKGIHVVTGEKVAIKVMDKRTLGDDLPRAKLEIEALKDLSHQNICQMYEVVETETKIFMILEHCSGGEMFDYIVERDRLQENEARFFFRQIVAAVAYIHSKGYAHRDLKPENLLLDEDQNIKLIDFGLCARPKGGMGVQLETFCGSPAYAAPELITGKEYLGSEVDIWSLGILLYTLLCGYLPFDDDNMGTLYRKIQSGSYDCPEWLTDETKDVINRMLQVEPKHRVTVAGLLEHPWLRHGYTTIQWRSIYFKQDLDDEIISELALYFARSKISLYDELRQWKYDYLMSTYFLLLQKKRRGCLLSLSHEETRAPIKMCQRINWELSSSLESGLNNAELLLLGSPKRNAGSVDSSSSTLSETSGSNKLQLPVLKVRELDKENFILPSCPPSSKKNRKPPKVVAPKLPTSAKLEVKETCNVVESDRSTLTDINREIGVPTPLVFKRQNSEEKLADKFQSPSLFTPIEKRCRSVDLDVSGHTIATKQNSVEMAAGQAMAVGTPTKSGSARQRVFGSIERQMDRVRHMLTPKKKAELFPGPPLNSPAPTPRKIKVKPTGLYNVSVVGSSGSGRKSTNAEAVLNTLQRALESKGIPCNRKGYILRNKIQNEQTGKVTLAFELEICHLQPPSHGSSVTSPDFPLIGVCRKRLKGDAWIYKNVVEEVLKVLNHIR